MSKTFDFSNIKQWQIPEGNAVKVEVGSSVLWQAANQATEQLTAPEISLDGSILTMTATDEQTEEFVIFVGGVETTTVVNLITFTIEGTTYYAEKGMTWGEWVNSEYNIGGFYITSTNTNGWNNVITNGSIDNTWSTLKIVCDNQTAYAGPPEFMEDTITSKFNYYLICKSSSGGIN